MAFVNLARRMAASVLALSLAIPPAAAQAVATHFDEAGVTFRAAKGNGAPSPAEIQLQPVLISWGSLTPGLVLQVNTINRDASVTSLVNELQNALRAQVKAGAARREALAIHHVLLQILREPRAVNGHIRQSLQDADAATIRKLNALKGKAGNNKARGRLDQYAKQLNAAVTAALAGDDEAFERLFDDLAGPRNADAAVKTADDDAGWGKAPNGRLGKTRSTLPPTARPDAGIGVAALAPSRSFPLKMSRFSWLSALLPKLFLNDLFILPTEIGLSRAKKIFSRSPGGAYFAVGTERSLAGAALSPGITDIIQADISPNVLAYNEINTTLLRISSDRNDYLRLRTQASHEEWMKLAGEKGLARDLETLNSDNFKAWRNWQAEAARDPHSVFMQMPHLNENALFWKIKALADQDRIRTVRLDLGDAQAARLLVRSLVDAGVFIGVLDISNTWMPGFLGRRFPQAVESFRDALAPDAILVLTNQIARQIMKRLADQLKRPAAAFSSVQVSFQKVRGKHELVVRRNKALPPPSRRIAPEDFDYYGFAFGDIFSYADENGLSGLATLHMGLVPAVSDEKQSYKANQMNSVKPVPQRPPVLLLCLMCIAVAWMMISKILLEYPGAARTLLRAVKWLFS